MTILYSTTPKQTCWIIHVKLFSCQACTGTWMLQGKSDDPVWMSNDIRTDPLNNAYTALFKPSRYGGGGHYKLMIVGWSYGGTELSLLRHPYKLVTIMCAVQTNVVASIHFLFWLTCWFCRIKAFFWKYMKKKCSDTIFQLYITNFD